jgi:type IV secretion system protein TrbL
MSVDPHDLINPFKYLASEAGKVIADGWTSAMLGLWNAGLWALRLVLNIIDSLLTPDLSANGPGRVPIGRHSGSPARLSWSC